MNDNKYKCLKKGTVNSWNGCSSARSRHGNCCWFSIFVVCCQGCSVCVRRVFELPHRSQRLPLPQRCAFNRSDIVRASVAWWQPAPGAHIKIFVCLCLADLQPVWSHSWYLEHRLASSLRATHVWTLVRAWAGQAWPYILSESAVWRMAWRHPALCAASTPWNGDEAKCLGAAEWQSLAVTWINWMYDGALELRALCKVTPPTITHTHTSTPPPPHCPPASGLLHEAHSSAQCLNMAGSADMWWHFGPPSTQRVHRDWPQQREGAGWAAWWVLGGVHCSSKSRSWEMKCVVVEIYWLVLLIILEGNPLIMWMCITGCRFVLFVLENIWWMSSKAHLLIGLTGIRHC